MDYSIFIAEVLSYYLWWRDWGYYGQKSQP